MQQMKSKLKINDKVIKNENTWKQHDFYSWRRGIGAGVVVESPISHDCDDIDYVDVRWPAGRCFEDASGLIKVDTNDDMTQYNVFIKEIKEDNQDEEEYISQKQFDYKYMKLGDDKTHDIRQMLEDGYKWVALHESNKPFMDEETGDDIHSDFLRKYDLDVLKEFYNL